VVGGNKLERADEILAAHPGSPAPRSYSAISATTARCAVPRARCREPLQRREVARLDALTHLCFSRYLRLDRARSERFVWTATALLDAGASANTVFETKHQPDPSGRATVRGAGRPHAEMTRLLLERGATPTTRKRRITHRNARQKRRPEDPRQQRKAHDDSSR